MIKINPSILSKTVKAITPKTEKVEEAQIRGTIVFRNNEQFVQLDGAPDNALTPISDVAEGASDAGFVNGDRVLVLLKNHQAIVTKNLTVGLQAQAAKEAGSFVTTITDEGITAQRIIANDTFTNTLRANHIRADDIIAGMATIETLDTNYAHITEGVIDNAKIGVADVNDLEANYAHITQGVIDNATIDQADVDNLDANYAHITQGVIDNAKIGVADVNDLSANYAHITQGVIDNATIDQAKINNLAANYAKVNAANIDSAAIRNAWVDKIMVQTGLLAYSSQVYTLDAIEVNAANITAGTLDVNRLIVTVGEGSSAQKYLVNIDPSTGTPSYEKLDGNIVAPRTITADKIVAGAITTNEITANNLQGTSGWINLHEGKFFYGDGANFASATNAISWNGSKLQIKADEFLLSTGQTIQDSIESVENWFYSVPPTTSNPPASSWTTTNLKEQHLRDIYFDTTSGKSYRWAKEGSTYKWVEIEDVELAALAKDLHDNYPPRSEFTVAPDQIQAVVTNEANARKAIYGTCGTAAGTTAKVVTCTNFARYTGAVVTVKFTNANTATVPTLNVNNTGAATIKSYKGGALTEAEYKWAADATLTFMFDGTYWRLQDSGSTAQIKVNADNIDLRVEKSGVIASINASTETSGGSAVKISADKVNIEGATIFSSGRLSQTSLNNAYDAKGAASTAESNAKSYADSLEAKSRPFVKGTQTAATGTWTGVCSELTELTEGQEILYYLPYAGSGNATLNLTLGNGSTTGAIACYYQNASRLTTHFGAGMTIPLVYHKNFNISGTNYTGWWTLSQYNSNSYDRKIINNAVKVAENIVQYCIAGRSGAGHKKLVSGLAIDLSYPICYLNQANISGQSYAVASGGTTTNFYTAIPSVSLQNTKASWTGTQYAMCYIKGTLSGNTFTVHSDIFTTTVPTSDDGFAYIPIGMLYSTYQVHFDCDNSVYGYRNGSFGPLANREASAAQATANAAKSTADAAAPKTAAVAEEQLIYISKASGTSSVAANTTWVTATSDSQNTWTTKRPTYSSSYPVLFIAKQKKTVSGTVTCTTPLKDDTTTVIDGGHITTGTIDASKATITNINADNITGGTLRIGSVPTDIARTSQLPTKVSQLTNDSSFATTSNVATAKSEAISAASTDATTKVNDTRSWYATCATAAATAAKVATISPTTTAFTTSVLKAGTTVVVKFTVTNSAAVGNLTLNVNSTGAKPIKTVRNNVLATIAGAGYLVNGCTYLFTYDGTNWVVQENYYSDTYNRTRYQAVLTAAEAITNGHIICGTASGYRDIAASVAFDLTYPLLYAATAIAKGATSGTRDNNYIEYNGITYSNNGTITSGGAAKTIYLKGTVSGKTFTIASSPFLTTVAPTSADGFVYIPLGIMTSSTVGYFHSSQDIWAYQNGIFHKVDAVSDYITQIDANGIWVTPSGKKPTNTSTGAGATGARINANGMQIYKAGVSVAEYGDTARVGKESGTNVQLSTQGMKVYDGDDTLAHIGVANNSSGNCTLVLYDYNYSSTTITTKHHIVSITSAKYDGKTDATSTVSIGSDGYSFKVTNRQAKLLVITYVTDTAIPTFILGSRNTDFSTSYGVYSTLTGEDNASTGVRSAVLGGYWNWVTGRDAVSIGGYNNLIYGRRSVALGGKGLLVYGASQVAMGQYNVASGNQSDDEPTDTDNAFIIGNGASSSSRSNAFAVKWNGEIESSRSGNVLWTGSWFMLASQTASFTNSQLVSDQLTGIVLVWSAYESNAAKDYDWYYQFVPKWHVLNHNGQGVDCIMPNNTMASNVVCKKYVYIYDDKIVGNDNNNKSGTGYANNTKVLRAVLGV